MLRKAFVRRRQCTGYSGLSASRKGQKHVRNRETNSSRGDSEMKQTMIVITLVFSLAPVAAFATPTPAQQASKDCASLRAKTGATAFVQAFGTNANHRNAFGKCVSLVARSQSASFVNAATACLTELNDTTFADTHGAKTFAQFYGTNTDLSNAFGNCVAQKLGTATTKLQASLSTAAKTCRSMRSTNPTGFRNTYGNRSNAFAKCVVAHAQTK